MLDSVVTREITFSSPKEMEDVTNAPPPLPPKTLKKRNGLGKPPAVEPPKIIGFQEVNRPVVKIPNGRNNDYVVNIHVKPAESDDVVQKQHPKIFSEDSKGHLDGCIRICVSNGPEGVHMQQADMKDNPYFFYGPLACQNGKSSSGQSSPSDTLDSGTCSDLDGSTPPPLPKRKSTTVGAANGITVTVNGRRGSLTSIENTNSEDSDNESNISCDSLNSSDLSEVQEDGDEPKLLKDDKAALPQNLLQDIRERTKTLATNDQPETYDVPIQKPKPNNVSTVPITSKSPLPIVEERTYEEKKASELKQEEDQQKSVESKRKAERSTSYETDRFYEFHMNENSVDPDGDGLEGDETFAGFKDIFDKDASSTIRSSKGTVRGVKNRVRAGIQTFLLNQATKGFKEKEQGKVVVYTTTMGIVRGTYQKCLKVKQILRTLLIKFEERDVYMSKEVQEEIKERMHCEYILVPQVFMEGQHLGDAETIDRLNESGELRRILKPFKCPGSLTPCEVCGGYRLLPCTVCNGSKKSVHRNHFSAEFVALKCMNCDESGLIRCHAC